MSTVRANAILDASGGNTATINSMTPTADSLQGFRNRIINGDMRIDQRNAGAAVTVNSSTDTYAVDRFPAVAAGGGAFSYQRSTTSATNFSNSLLATVTTVDSSIAAADFYGIQHKIEGFNTADFNSGTANAKTITLSFWVRSSVTGTYGVSFGNNANNRWYPSSYSISSANTWEQKSITLTCDTSGTWDTTTGTGLWIWFDLGSGSDYQGTSNAWAGSTKFTISGATQWIANSGATFYITGVQLEVGSVATPFERRDYGTELSRCFRYFQMISSGNNSALPIQFIGQSGGVSIAPFGNMPLVSAMRTAPTFVQTASQWRFNGSNGDVNVNGTWTVNTGGFEGANYQSINVSFSATASVGAITQARIITNGGYLGASAEL